MAMIDKEIQLLMLKGEKGDPGIAGDYNELTNKPKINGVELLGNKTASDLGLASEADLNAAVADIATNAANISTNTTNIGALNDLTTTVKSSLVAAINEVNADTFSKNVGYGTWTPAIDVSPGSSVYPLTVSYQAQHGTYCKVGKLVYIAARIRLTISAAGSSDARPIIKTLPYPMDSLPPDSSYGRHGLFTLSQLLNNPVLSPTSQAAFHLSANGSHILTPEESNARWQTATDATIYVSGVYLTTY